MVYVGTGEANNRQSSSIGDGVWGTTDGGKTWNHLGLEDTQSIGRIVVDPTNPNIVYVAAMGHLFGPNPERGLFKSADGGKTWKKSKYIDPDTGFTDVAIDPVESEDPVRGVARSGGAPGGATTAADRAARCGRPPTAATPGPSSMVRAGRSRRTASTAASRFRSSAPSPPRSTRRWKPARAAAPAAARRADGGPARGGRGGSAAAGESSAGERRRPARRGAAGGGGGGGGRGGRGGRPLLPIPTRSGVFRSDDGGKTWTFMSNQNQRPTYFSQIRVDPVNDQKLFVGGNPGADVARWRQDLDAGSTGSHTDYHAFWINPKDPRIVCIGHDGGLDISNDGGFTWDYHNDIAVGQFYQVSADMRRPYVVCGGLQDNNAWCGPSALRSTAGAVNTDWFTVAGGDGFYTRQDPTDWAIVYAESQDGNMTPSRSAQRHAEEHPAQRRSRPRRAQRRRRRAPAPATPAATRTLRLRQTPKAPARDAAARRRRAAAADAAALPTSSTRRPTSKPFRFYWNAPIEISPHNPAVDLHGGAVLLQVHQPRRHVVDEPDGSDQERQPLVAGNAHHGRRRR